MNLINAKNKTLSESPALPDMSESVLDFAQEISAGVITKSNVGGYIRERTSWVKTKAVRTPLASQQIKLKPEGQRTWKWEQLVTHTNLVLKVDDRVRIKDTVYRVMGKFDFSEYGFFEYHVTEDFE